MVGCCNRSSSFTSSFCGDGNITAGDGSVRGNGDAPTTVNGIAPNAALEVGVGYDNGFGGTIGPIAVGPPEQSQHNIRRTRRRRIFRWWRRRENQKNRSTSYLIIFHTERRRRRPPSMRYRLRQHHRAGYQVVNTASRVRTIRKSMGYYLKNKRLTWLS